MIRLVAWILEQTPVRILITSHYPMLIIALAPFLALSYPQYVVPAFAASIALLLFGSWGRLEFARYMTNKTENESEFKHHAISYLVDIDRADLVAEIMKRMTDDPELHDKLDKLAAMKQRKQ